MILECFPNAGDNPPVTEQGEKVAGAGPEIPPGNASLSLLTEAERHTAPSGDSGHVPARRHGPSEHALHQPLPLGRSRASL